MNRLTQQAEEIEKARQIIASQEKAPIFNETIAMADEISQRAEQAMRINEQTKAEIASKLPQIQEDADKARQVQGLEQQQQQNQQKIASLNYYFRSAVLAFQVNNLYNVFDFFDQMEKKGWIIYKS